MLSRAVPVFWDRCYDVKLAPASIKMWHLGRQVFILRLCISHNTHTLTQREMHKGSQKEHDLIGQSLKTSPPSQRLVFCLCADMLQSSHLEQCAHKHTLHQQDQTASPPIWEQAWEHAENILTISLCEFKSLFQAWLCSLIYSTSKRWLYNLINFS